VDMKQLFQTLGVKPEQIRKIQAIAEMNRRGRLEPPGASQNTSGLTEAAQARAGRAATPEGTADATARPGASVVRQGSLEAQLPPPPEQDSQFDVLLRPGLLGDVEIVIDKVSNAIYIPNQAVFEKEGKLIVYVKN